jgi:hypothetical protein
MKNEIKHNFLTVFKTQNIIHMVVQKLKEIKKNLGETMREYDKRFKDLLSQIPYLIGKKILVQWYIVGLLQKIRDLL